MDCRAIGSKDSVIEVIDIRERENVFSLVGHQGEVTFVSFDPKGEYLSSVSVDGTHRIWNLTKKSCESSKPGLSKELCTSLNCSWSESGDLLVIPYGNEIQFIQVSFVDRSNS